MNDKDRVEIKATIEYEMGVFLLEHIVDCPVCKHRTIAVKVQVPSEDIQRMTPTGIIHIKPAPRMQCLSCGTILREVRPSHGPTYVIDDGGNKNG